MGSGSSSGPLLGFNHPVFGRMNRGFECFVVGFFGIKRNRNNSAHVADFVDVHNSIGLTKNSGEVVAAGLTGEAFDPKVSFVTHYFKTVFSDRFFNVGDFYLACIILDHDCAGFDAGRTVVDAGDGTEGDFGRLSNSLLFKSVDSKLDHGGTGIGDTGSGVAFVGGIFTRAFSDRGRVLGVCKSPESEERCENDNVFHEDYAMG